MGAREHGCGPQGHWLSSSRAPLLLWRRTMKMNCQDARLRGIGAWAHVCMGAARTVFCSHSPVPPCSRALIWLAAALALCTSVASAAEPTDDEKMMEKRKDSPVMKAITEKAKPTEVPKEPHSEGISLDETLNNK